MSHVFEPAMSGRSKCRGCGKSIEKGEIRFGEHLPNPFGEGEMTLWFHPLCAAYKQPEQVLETLPESTVTIANREEIERAARGSFMFRRIPRIDGAERAPSARAVCRSCKNRIERGNWRIKLVFFEEGRFSPGGYVHLECRETYFEGGDIRDQVLYFSPALGEEERGELRHALDAALPKDEAAQ
jgi:hypothetical protein